MGKGNPSNTIHNGSKVSESSNKDEDGGNDISYNSVIDTNKNTNPERDFVIIEEFRNKVKEQRKKLDRLEVLDKKLHNASVPFSGEINDLPTFEDQVKMAPQPIDYINVSGNKRQKLEGIEEDKPNSEEISVTLKLDNKLNASVSNFSEIPRICSTCKSSIYRSLSLKCICCHLLYHPKCVNLTDIIANTIQVFVCHFCTAKNSELKTVYKEGNAPKYCICQSTNEDRFMIGCDNCDEWYHGDCIKISEMRASVIEKFYCKKCKIRNPDLEIVYKDAGFLTGAISFNYEKEDKSKLSKNQSATVIYNPTQFH